MPNDTAINTAIIPAQQLPIDTAIIAAQQQSIEPAECHSIGPAFGHTIHATDDAPNDAADDAAIEPAECLSIDAAIAAAQPQAVKPA